MFTDAKNATNSIIGWDKRDEAQWVVRGRGFFLLWNQFQVKFKVLVLT